MISLVFATVLLAAADPAAGSGKADKAKPDEMVCKKEAVVGSRMKQRVCMTQADWDRRKQEARDELEKSQSVKPLTF